MNALSTDRNRRHPPTYEDVYMPSQSPDDPRLPSLDTLPPEAYIRMHHVLALTSLKRSTLFDQIKLSRFPAQVKLTAHASGWRVSDVRAWLQDPAAWRAATTV